MRLCGSRIGMMFIAAVLAGCGTVPAVSTDQLVANYGLTVSALITRIRSNPDKKPPFVVFESAIGYVQCQADKQSKAIYCEAQSAAAWEGLLPVLTPERVAELHELGYADPRGTVPNYWKSYPLNKYSDDAIAKEILTILHDVYGYRGKPGLKIRTR